jgi:RNA polymerase sigma-70 factor (ECF subfamily)
MSTAEFGNMISTHQQFLQTLALKLTKSGDDANDLMQETFFKAIKNREKYQEGTNIKGWLYTIMKNTFINNYRKKKNQNTFVDETENKYFINSKQAEKDVRTDRLVDQSYLMRQLETVDRTYLDTFMMHYNGYKYEEISEILDIPLGTVKSRIFLARRKMMEKLQDYRY